MWTNEADLYMVMEFESPKDFQQLVQSLKAESTQGKICYGSIPRFPNLTNQQDIDAYTKLYEEWKASNEKNLSGAPKLRNPQLEKTLCVRMAEVLRIYEANKPGASDSMKKNLFVKLIYWIDMFLGEVLNHWDRSKKIKVITENIEKEAEKIFAYLIKQLGGEVLIVRVEGGIEQALKGAPEKTQTPPPKIVINQDSLIPTQSTEKREKTFEELALMASSVVMISMYDRQGEIVGSGSGIAIGKEGYILTNCHVISGKDSFSVRLEDDEKEYIAEGIIKYNYVLDLAIIKIPRKLIPIPMYEGTESLVRGQKVVAIGSPLGLFNSVSDGIISGFRKFDNVDMIQFTAPTSHGSSGGALLNMYGEVIGISTAGMNDGQNLNLAVSYDTINPFIRGFRS